MRACGFAGRTNIANNLSLNDVIALKNNILTVVGIESLRAVVVLNNNIASVTAVPPSASAHNDFAGGGSNDWSANRSRNINAVISMQPLGAPAVDRPQIVADVFLR